MIRVMCSWRLSDLVAGLIILAVGSVVATEQFSNKDAQSRCGSMNGLAGSVCSAPAFVHAGWVEDGWFARGTEFGDSATIKILRFKA